MLWFLLDYFVVALFVRICKKGGWVFGGSGGGGGGSHLSPFKSTFDLAAEIMALADRYLSNYFFSSSTQS